MNQGLLPCVVTLFAYRTYEFVLSRSYGGHQLSCRRNAEITVTRLTFGTSLLTLDWITSNKTKCVLCANLKKNA